MLLEAAPSEMVMGLARAGFYEPGSLVRGNRAAVLADEALAEKKAFFFREFELRSKECTYCCELCVEDAGISALHAFPRRRCEHTFPQFKCIA